MSVTAHHSPTEFEFAGWRCRTGRRGSGLPTAPQAQVIAGLAAGLTQKEIAKLRGCSPATVKAAVTTLLYLLHAHRAAGAVAEALRRGWIAPLVLVLIVSALNPHAEAMRHRPPTRTRQPVSTTVRLTRRDTGSQYA
ncbi:regulatory protein, luxR family [Halomonas shengliensis]|uniref:Regulatory protein, luxR family n=1 Tax=Halomonas shengliensis TaxID=419597 RepID=A0A1H0IBM4_9GAMM|nr:LuxR C-terminal-related transcriptional regulator [Halomonas shengliensis]SDO28827.1 regulatory protein, luxR family [Halomonas shengliensis]